ncbi:winged helix-turn-helix transcriptional regulator [Cetobacterium sp.]|uniref:winged helix-turn-helix transcriptional regulator n=1 Tax=Cetobacterium sp. TaxID=2071632 RepID=UPI003AF1966B
MVGVRYPFEMTFKIFKRKWSVLIIWELNQKSLRLSELGRILEGCNEKVLIETLDSLIQYDIVKKRCNDGYPRYVEYSLTSLGKMIVPILKEADNFGKKYIENLIDEI